MHQVSGAPAACQYLGQVGEEVVLGPAGHVGDAVKARRLGAVLARHPHDDRRVHVHRVRRILHREASPLICCLEMSNAAETQTIMRCGVTLGFSRLALHNTPLLPQCALLKVFSVHKASDMPGAIGRTRPCFVTIPGVTRTCTATVVCAPNIICMRPMSHFEPSDTKISSGLMTVSP